MTSADEQAIREVVETWMAATETGETATVLDLMTDDVVFMVPDGEPFGKAAFASASTDREDVHIEGTFDIQELEVIGEWAYLRNHLELTMTPGGESPPVRRSGYTLTILRKGSDGRWRVARDANLVTVED